MQENKEKSELHALHKDYPAEAVPTRADGYNIKKIPCCFLLQNSEGQNVIKLNETGVLIWELCSGELSVGDMLELLVESFPDAAEHIKIDLNRVLDELESEKVITIS